MAIQLVLVPLGHLARLGITSASMRAGAGTFAQSLPYGAGYSAGTFIGFPGNYKGRSSTTRRVKSFVLDGKQKMAYGKKFSFRRTRWFNKRVWNNKYRKYVFIHRSYGGY